MNPQKENGGGLKACPLYQAEIKYLKGLQQNTMQSWKEAERQTCATYNRLGEEITRLKSNIQELVKSGSAMREKMESKHGYTIDSNLISDWFAAVAKCNGGREGKL